MPELPEVEWVRRGLEAARWSGSVRGVWRSRLRLRRPLAREGVARLRGAIPGAIERRGKVLLWHFTAADGATPLGCLVHLGMSGRLEIAPRDAPRARHTHLELVFADGRALRFVDPRRFGDLRVAPWDELVASPPVSELGPDPWPEPISGSRLEQRLRGTMRPIWAALLDQRVLAGIGNIYALEALHRAGIHPLVPAARLRAAQLDHLARGIHAALEGGVAGGGTTLRDYRQVDGRRGGNAPRLQVYGRAGSPCRRCRRVLDPVHAGGRSGAFCAACQPPWLS
jgi:formamidopyrimidine-DNA glycosylase